jgi:hypothetical protein
MTGAAVASRLTRLNDVTALASDDAWAVGWQSDGGIAGNLVEHWDGRGWRVVATPEAGQSQFLAVAGTSGSDVWAVGERSSFPPLIEHWDGRRWDVVLHDVVEGAFADIAALTPDNAWIVGWAPSFGYGTYPPFGVKNLPRIEHWDGRSWQDYPFEPVSQNAHNDTFGRLDSVSANSATDIWAAGYQGEAGISKIDLLSHARPLVEHWDGRRWSIVPTRLQQMKAAVITAIATGPNGDAWVIGRTTSASERSFVARITCRSRGLRSG